MSHTSWLLHHICGQQLRLSLFKSQSHFFLQKIIAYHRYILHVIVISYAKLNKSLVIFFFLNCTLKCCCLTINFKMMYRYIDHVKLDVHVKISVICYIMLYAIYISYDKNSLSFIFLLWDFLETNLISRAVCWFQQ